MGSRKVYPVRCYNGGLSLTVMVDGNQVPMEEFIQTHIPIQVTSLFPFNSNEPLLTVALMIAEEDGPPATS